MEDYNSQEHDFYSQERTEGAQPPRRTPQHPKAKDPDVPAPTTSPGPKNQHGKPPQATGGGGRVKGKKNQDGETERPRAPDEFTKEDIQRGRDRKDNTITHGPETRKIKQQSPTLTPTEIKHRQRKATNETNKQTKIMKINTKKQYDIVIMNPPFHLGQASDSSVGNDFITKAAEMLNNNGTLVMVANRQLPYEKNISKLFKSVTISHGQSGFKIIQAKKPKNLLNR